MAVELYRVYSSCDSSPSLVPLEVKVYGTSLPRVTEMAGGGGGEEVERREVGKRREEEIDIDR